MPFTAHDLRYKADETYPALYAHLNRHAQNYLKSLRFDTFELDIVVGHVVEQLVRMGILGGGDNTPLTALDKLENAQFYAFLNRSIRNKAIDRLRKRHLPISFATELETRDGIEGDEDPLNSAVESMWGTIPFATPEQAALALASQEEHHYLLKNCIKTLCAAPHQLQAILLEIEEFGAVTLLQEVVEELKDELLSPPGEGASAPIAHVSQNKDHAHKKLRHCLQESSTNLIVMMALRLTKYGARSSSSDEFFVELQALAQQDLSEDDVRTGLKELVTKGLLNWDGSAMIQYTPAQKKQLMHFYPVHEENREE